MDEAVWTSPWAGVWAAGIWHSGPVLRVGDTFSQALRAGPWVLPGLQHQALKGSGSDILLTVLIWFSDSFPDLRK